MRQTARQCGQGAALLGLAVVLTACGAAAEADPSAGSPVTDHGGDPGRLEVRADLDRLAFVPTRLRAEPDQAFTVRFANDTDQAHSWALVPAGKEQAALSRRTGAGAPVATPTLIRPVPPGQATAAPPVDGALLADSGGTVATNAASMIEVSKLPAGEYTYLCTVGDHAAQGMTGTLTVR